MAVERIEREVRIERQGARFEGMRVSWGGIWAGVLVVLGTQLFLTTLGLAVGISADSRRVDPTALGTGAVVWSALSLLVALFLGGMAATRMSMVWERSVGLLQGVLVWVISLVAVTYFGAHGIGIMGGSALGIVTGAAASLPREPSATAWIQFIAVALSLLAAIGGGALGQRRAARRASTEPLQPPP
jgi:cytochrome c oxidase subunit IV